MMIAGIDPGVTGAIAILSGSGTTYTVEDIPSMAADKKGKRNQINPLGIRDILEDSGVEVVFLEKTHAMPGSTVVAHSQGDSRGCIRSVCAILGIPVEYVTPKTWKKYYGLGKDKEVCRAKAIELFPNAPLGRKKDHNRAEALLIAKYGFDKY